MKKKSREFSRNEILAGGWCESGELDVLDVLGELDELCEMGELDELAELD